MVSAIRGIVSKATGKRVSLKEVFKGNGSYKGKDIGLEIGNQ